MIKTLKKFRMQDCHAVKTPGTAGDKCLDDYANSQKIPLRRYQEAIGSIMYLAIRTRPDITFTISKLSQYNKDPREIHWTAVKRLLRYLKGTMDYCLKLKPIKGQLNASTDASWCTTPDAKSFSGYLLKIGESLIGWKSAKQKLVALSTMEAELIGACDATSAVKWIRYFLEELHEEELIRDPTEIQTDSKAVIDWIKNPKISDRTRHINRKFHYIKDETNEGKIFLRYRNTMDLEADILTKHITSDIMNGHLNSLNIGLDG